MKELETEGKQTYLRTQASKHGHRKNQQDVMFYMSNQQLAFRLGALRCMTSHVATVISVAHCELRTRQRETRNIPEPGNYSVPHLNIVVGWSGPWTAQYFWLVATSGPASQCQMRYTCPTHLTCTSVTQSVTYHLKKGHKTRGTHKLW